jgi:hypothetical protein
MTRGKRIEQLEKEVDQFRVEIADLYTKHSTLLKYFHLHDDVQYPTPSIVTPIVVTEKEYFKNHPPVVPVNFTYSDYQQSKKQKSFKIKVNVAKH